MGLMVAFLPTRTITQPFRLIYFMCMVKYGVFPVLAMDGLVYFERYLNYAKQIRVADLLGWIYVFF